MFIVAEDSREDGLVQEKVNLVKVNQKSKYHFFLMHNQWQRRIVSEHINFL